MGNQDEHAALETIPGRIQIVRGEKVLLDSDLAELYGVPTKRLNEQVRRNPNRFPPDFLFQMTDQEVNRLRSQVARAIEVSVYVVRAFIRLRATLAAQKDLARKLDELERKTAALTRGPQRADRSASLRLTRCYCGLTSLRPTMPAMINRIDPMRSKPFGSLNRMIPRIATPTAPMPVHTA